MTPIERARMDAAARLFQIAQDLDRDEKRRRFTHAQILRMILEMERAAHLLEMSVVEPEPGWARFATG